MTSPGHRFIIADGDHFARRALASRLAAAPQVAEVKVFPNLTGTFNEVEHYGADVVLVSAPLAALPEFEVMETLFRLTGVAWAVVADAAAGLRLSAQRQRPGAMPILAPDAAIRDFMYPPKPRVPAASGTAPQPVLRPSVTSAASRESVRMPLSPGRPPEADGVSARPTGASVATTARGMILIGASTGGIDALLTVLSNFGADCPPTLIVQHTGAQFAQGLADLLDRAVAPRVRLADPAGERLSAGTVLLSPGGDGHLVLSRSDPMRCQVVEGPLQSGHRPSVDALFLSAVPFARRVTAAILTGMGRDGAEGMKALRDGGARTFGQDEATSLVYGMPRVAFELGGVETQLPLGKIGPAILAPAPAAVR